MKDADLCRVIDTIGQYSAESFSTLKGLQFLFSKDYCLQCNYAVFRHFGPPACNQESSAGCLMRMIDDS
jgi:hypothetical protein